MYFTTPESRDLLKQNPLVVVSGNCVPALMIAKELNDRYLEWYHATHDCNGHVDFYVYSDEQIAKHIMDLNGLYYKVQLLLDVNNQILRDATQKLLDTIQIDLDDLRDIMGK